MPTSERSSACLRRSCGRLSLAFSLVLSMHDDSVASRWSERAGAAADENVVATTTSFSSSTSYENCIDFANCDYDVVIADGGEFETLHISIDGEDALDDSNCSLDEALKGAALEYDYYDGNVISGISTSLAPGARVLRCSGEDLYDVDFPGGDFDFTDLHIVATAAFDRNGDPVAPPRFCASNVDCEDDHCGYSYYLSEPKCGDAIYNGYVNTADALVVLRTSVGTSTCEPFPTSCDADGDGHVTVSDALAILKVAVGQSRSGLACPMPCND